MPSHFLWLKIYHFIKIASHKISNDVNRNPREAQRKNHVVCLICQFRFGFDSFWTGIITLFGILLAAFTKKNIEKILMVLMGGAAASLTLTTLFPNKTILEINMWWPEEIASVWIQLFCVCICFCGKVQLYIASTLTALL